MARREAKALTRESCNNLLIESISFSFDFLPLPNPPLELPDFPARPPAELSKIIQQALGISSVDTAGFLYRLEQVIDKEEPDFVKRHIDPDREREKWLTNNFEMIAEQILILQIKDWFNSALDENSPDTDRWYLAISVFIGLILRGSETTEAQCFPLFNSIIIARQPGNFTIKSTGPHHISWNGKNGDNFTEEIAHPSGILAANSILDILELYEINHQTVLPYWLERLSISGHISNLLNIPARLQNLVLDSNEHASENLVMSAILLFPHHPEQSKEILFEICNSEQISLRKNLASNLSRIGSEDYKFTQLLLEKLLYDKDSDTRVLSTSYLGTLARLEKYIFISFAKTIFQNEDSRMIQRLIESGIRHYLSMNPDDDDGLIPIAWVSCNSESKSKLSGMLIELAKINEQSFIKISSNIFDLSPDSHDELFNRINFRNKQLGSLIKSNQ